VTVLLVDDDDRLRRMCRTLLAECGFRVLEAGNGLDALIILMKSNGALDLVITDLDMPKVSGAELGRVIKEIWPEVNVLYMSGSQRETVREELPSDCAFLTKPFVPRELAKAVQATFDCSATHQAG
jgi:two-component system cell cycle sensor histidine kinase/response regulator CckA